MKKIIIILSLLIYTVSLTAQTLSNKVVATSGSNITVGNINVSATLGETFTKTIAANNLQLTQGFQQPDNNKVKQYSFSYTNANLCSGSSYTFNGITYTAAGVYTKHLTNANGLDSAAILVLTSSTPTTSITNITIPSGNYTFNGTTYTATGIYTAHLINAAGCDSAATLNLTVTSAPPLTITGAATLCVGSQTTLTANINGGVWSSGNNRASVNAAGIVTGASVGIAIIKYKLSNGNSETHNITVNSQPNIPSFYYAAGTPNPQYGVGGGFCANKTFTVVGNPSGGVWSKTGVITVTSPSGVVTTGSVAGSGSLTYTYTNSNGCSNSRTINGNVVICASRGVNNQSINQSINQQFTMFPNPAKTLISINVETLLSAGTIVITDLYGKQVKIQSLSVGNNIVDIASFSKGIYLVSIITAEGKNTKKLVVE